MPSTPGQQTGTASTPSTASTPGLKSSMASSSGTKDKGKEKEEFTEDQKGKSKLELTRDEGRREKDPAYNWVNAPDVTENFKRFDIVTGEGRNPNFLTYSINREFLHRDERSQKKHIIKQWKKSNVPDSMYIRVYKTNIDLVRAVIVGAQGTPYHDGLFFFDIHLPRGYPEQPPYVDYHLHGKLNENYQVSDQLIKNIADNTKWWQWNKLSILQVLRTIQDNILNAEPFFNQGAYKSVDRDDNEKTFLKSCRTMLSILRNPPTDFEPLVAQHFRSRGLFRLEVIKAYTNYELCLAGSFVDDGASPSDSDAKPINDALSSSNPTQQPDKSKSDAKPINDGSSSSNPTQQSDKNMSDAKPVNDEAASSNPTQQLDNIESSVPDKFKCPLSGKLMTDPVLWNGVIYERCSLSHSDDIVACHSLREDMINWFQKQRLKATPYHLIPKDYYYRLNLKVLIEKFNSGYEGVEKEAAKLLAWVTKKKQVLKELRWDINKVLDMLLTRFAPYEEDFHPISDIQKHAINITYNLARAIQKYNLILPQESMCLPILVKLLNNEDKVTRQRTLWSLYRISSVAVHRNHIVELGALTPLMELLGRGEKGAGALICILCIDEENRNIIVSKGVVSVVLKLLNKGEAISECLSILEVLMSNREIENVEVVSSLFYILHKNLTKRNIVSCLSVLHKIISDNNVLVREILVRDTNTDFINISSPINHFGWKTLIKSDISLLKNLKEVKAGEIHELLCSNDLYVGEEEDLEEDLEEA